MKASATLPTYSPLVPALAIYALLVGCQAVPRYALTTRKPHKDCLAIRVLIEQRQDPAVYRTIADVELGKILQEKRELPLYEVRFEFRRRDATGEKLALVVARPQASRSAAEATVKTTWETFLYP